MMICENAHRCESQGCSHIRAHDAKGYCFEPCKDRYGVDGSKCREWVPVGYDGSAIIEALKREGINLRDTVKVVPKKPFEDMVREMIEKIMREGALSMIDPAKVRAIVREEFRAHDFAHDMAEQYSEAWANEILYGKDALKPCPFYGERGTRGVEQEGEMNIEKIRQANDLVELIKVVDGELWRFQTQTYRVGDRGTVEIEQTGIKGLLDDAQTRIGDAIRSELTQRKVSLEARLAAL